MRTLALLALAMLTATAAGAAPVYYITDLGTTGGGSVTGTAINQFGQIAGYGVDATGNLYSFTASSGVAKTTPSWATGGAMANGINASGQVVGTSYVNGNAVATSWTNGTATALGGLGGADSYAMAINSAGQIAGMATNAQGLGAAVVYSGGTVENVGLPGTSWSAAYGINSSGEVAANAMRADGTIEAYTWSQSAGYTVLGSLGGSNSYAFGVNDQGQVVGNSNTRTGATHATLWSGGGATDLGTLGGSASSAYGINNSGSVVGYSYIDSSGVTHAFLVVGGVMYDLNSLVANLGGWTLTAAYAINGSGDIVGVGTLNGVEHAFRLVDPPGASPVPEPATTATLAVGLLAVAVGSVRRRRTSRRR